MVRCQTSKPLGNGRICTIRTESANQGLIDRCRKSLHVRNVELICNGRGFKLMDLFKPLCKTFYPAPDLTGRKLSLTFSCRCRTTDHRLLAGEKLENIIIDLLERFVELAKPCQA